MGMNEERGYDEYEYVRTEQWTNVEGECTCELEKKDGVWLEWLYVREA